MKSLTMLLAVLSLIFASAVNAPRVLELSSPACFACVGCKASKVTDPITNTLDGVRTSFPPLECAAVLDPEPGKCEIVQDQGEYVCGPTGNCTFVGKYRIFRSSKFRNDDWPNCDWSTGDGPQTLSESTTWIAACDDAVTYRTVNFYERASACNDGQFIGYVQFAGICSRCPPIQ